MYNVDTLYTFIKFIVVLTLLFSDTAKSRCHQISLKRGLVGKGEGGGSNTPIPGGEIDITYLKPDTHYFLVDKYNKNKTSIISIFKLSLYFNKQSYKKVYKLRFFG